MNAVPTSEVLISVALFGVIIHAYLSGQYVAQRELTTNWFVATFVIFFSGMWFVGPFTYFGFRKNKPLLAKSCLRQMFVFMAAWVLVMFIDHFSRNW